MRELCHRVAFIVATGAAALSVPMSIAHAQQAVTREQVVAAALTRGPRLVLARTDSATAVGELRAARAYPNPTFTGSYTKDVPQYHAIAELPLDLTRGPRVGSARAGLRAASARYGFERAAVRFDAETTYTRALTAASHARLSQHSARDADSLRTLAIVRRDAGDASELDVALATVSAGQAENIATADSLTALAALLNVERVMGLPASEPTIVLADTLVLTDTTATAPPSAPPPGGVGPGAPATQAPTSPVPVTVAAAEADLAARERALSVARLTAFGTPDIQLGADWHDPSPGAPKGLLPVIGAIVPIPLFNRGRGDVAVATAARDRAAAQLEIARRESEASIAQVTREQTVALSRVARDRTLLAAASRVAAMSLTAFAEGAVALPNVLDAQRAVREGRAQYIDDVAAANNAAAELRLLTTTTTPQP